MAWIIKWIFFECMVQGYSVQMVQETRLRVESFSLNQSALIALGKVCTMQPVKLCFNEIIWFLIGDAG